MAFTKLRIAESMKADYIQSGSNRQWFCLMERGEVDAGFELRKMKLDGWVLVLDGSLRAKNGGGMYRFTPEDVTRIDRQILQSEQNAAEYAGYCRGR